MFKKIRRLEKRIEDLEKVIPKLHSLMIKSVPNLPCEYYKECLCGKCNKNECAYNPNTTIVTTSETIINDVLHI